MSVLRPDLMMKCVVPVIMAGIIAVSMITLENAFSQVMELTPYSFPVDLWSRRRCPYFRLTYAVPLLPPSFIFTYSTTSGSWNVTCGIIHLPRCRSLGRSCRSRCRFRNRYRRWRRCPRNCSTAQTFRRHGMSIYTQVCNRMRTLMDGYDRFWFSFSLKCWVFTDLSLRLLWTPRLTIWPVS